MPGRGKGVDPFKNKRVDSVSETIHLADKAEKYRNALISIYNNSDYYAEQASTDRERYDLERIRELAWKALND